MEKKEKVHRREVDGTQKEKTVSTENLNIRQPREGQSGRVVPVQTNYHVPASYAGSECVTEVNRMEP